MTGPTKPPRSVLITGASSGLGEALAGTYAASGVSLALGGRNRDRLGAVAEACRARGATVTIAAVDVAERAAMAEWIAAADDEGPLDLVIANAGISAGTAGGAEVDDEARAIFAVNLGGVLNTIQPAIPHMRARHGGQIALISSVAAFLGLPGTPAYAASKAAVRIYGEGLRGLLAADGVRVSVVCPGFFESPMTAANPFPMPFLMPAERAARIIQDGLARNKARIAFPWPVYLAVRLLGSLPPAWTGPLLARAARKF